MYNNRCLWNALAFRGPLQGHFIKTRMYEGRSINKLQNSVILLVFQISKNLKYTFCRKFNSEYLL